MVQPIGRNVWCFLTMLDIDLLYDPAIALLSICSREMKRCPHKTDKPIFLAVLFLEAKGGNSPNVHQLMNG